MAWLRDYDYAQGETDIRGAPVYGADDEKLGTVEDVVLDNETGDARYLVIDAGWLTTRRFMIPVDQAFARDNKDDLLVNLTKAEVNRLPAFNTDHLRSDTDFGAYERSYRSVWRYDVDRAKQQPSSRLERFRESLRKRFSDLKRKRIEPMPAQSESRPTGPTAGVTGPEAVVRPGEPRRSVEGVASGQATSRVVPHATGVFGIYGNRPELERAVGGLKDIGFQNTDISVLFPDTEKTRDFAVEHRTKAPEGALAGGGTGLVVGGALGWLAGIGALAIPGIGPFIAAGPIVAAIAGAGIGTAIGGIAGALIGLGVPEYEAKRYESEVKKGGILLSVHCEDIRYAETARKVLERTGAKDIFVAEEKRAA